MTTDLLEGVEDGAYGWCQRSGGICGRHAPDGGLTVEGPAHEVVLVDDDGEVVDEGDTAAGGDEGLCFDGFVAVAG